MPDAHLSPHRHPARADQGRRRGSTPALLDLGVPVSVVATKADKIGRSHIPKHVKVIRETLRTPVDIWPVSAEKRTGLEDLWRVMEGDLAAPSEPSAPNESPDTSSSEAAQPERES